MRRRRRSLRELLGTKGWQIALSTNTGLEANDIVVSRGVSKLRLCADMYSSPNLYFSGVNGHRTVGINRKTASANRRIDYVNNEYHKAQIGE